MSAARQLYVPRPAAVRTDDDGRPLALAGVAIESIREDWWVEDRWWTTRPLCRHYYELILANGRSATVFHDLRTRRWHGQRA